MGVDIEYDTDKDAANIAKHGMSLEVGELVLAFAVVTIEDTRRAYGEARFNAYAVVADQALVCAYTMRGETCRIISVRPASRKERAAWLS